MNEKNCNKLQDKVKDVLREIFNSIGEPGEFEERVGGYCVVYSPHACVFLETRDGDEEFLEKIFDAFFEMVTGTVDTNLKIENVWIPF